MNFVTILLIIILAIVAFVLALKFLKVAFKWIALGIIVLVLIAAVFGINVYSDFTDLRENLPTSDLIFHLEDNKNIVASFKGKLSDPTGSVSFANATMLEYYDNAYRQKNFDDLRGKNYKAVIVSSSALNESATVKNMSVAKALSIIRSQDSLTDYSKFMLKKEDLGVNSDTLTLMKKNLASFGLKTSEDVRGALFAYILASHSKLELVQMYRNEGLVVHDKSIVLSLVSCLPLSTIKGWL